MHDQRLRSIVPLFGGATRYVETLDAMLGFVAEHQPTTDELVGWHRGTFDRVSSADSIVRRVEYLEAVGFLATDGEHWTIGPEGEEYLTDQSTETLTEIMCRRNVGLRSLLYALAAGPMTIEEISRQQLGAHPQLGWDPTNTDMAKQRANWLQSLGLVEKDDDMYRLSDAGVGFVDDAIETWANTEQPNSGASSVGMEAGTYETTVQARTVDPEFRATVLGRHDATCPVSRVDHPQLLDVAHVLPWSEYPDHRADPTNVIPLSKTHHAAFDRGLFTIDHDFHLRVNPTFETESRVLQQTLCDRTGESLSLSEGLVDPDYLQRHNESLVWLS
jgi:putative restriction endonuclease